MDTRQRCRIRIHGFFSQSWSEWFDGFDISHVNDVTILSGTLSDQAAVYGLLNKIRDLGIDLISVEIRGENEWNHCQIDLDRVEYDP
jgi:hypothetical protein